MLSMTILTKPIQIVKLLKGEVTDKHKYEGLVPKDWQITDMDTLPDDLGIGITDVGTQVPLSMFI